MWNCISHWYLEQNSPSPDCNQERDDAPIILIPKLK